MIEYLKSRCCMCPNSESDKQSLSICPGIIGTLHEQETPCRFVKIYQDNRGWIYSVHSGIGGDTFKTFYLKPGKSGGGHGCSSVDWQNSFDEAQADLNSLAESKKWKEVAP